MTHKSEDYKRHCAS